MIKLFAILLALCLTFSVVNSVSTEESNAMDIEYNGFVLGTLGTFTSTRNVSGGFSAYLGAHKNNIGLGILGSYEIGLYNDLSDIKDDRFINAYASLSYQLGKSTLMFSQGLSFFTIEFSAWGLNYYSEDVRRHTTAISYLYQPVGRLTFMFQGKLQNGPIRWKNSTPINRDLVLSVGIGF